MIYLWIAITAIIFGLIASVGINPAKYNATVNDDSGKLVFPAWSIHAVLLAVVVFVALSIRLHRIMLSAESIDYNLFLSPWYQFIIENGGLSALKFDFSDYSPPFLYLLALSARIFGSDGDPYLPIKIIPISFDVINAFLVYRLIQNKYPKGMSPVLGVFVFLLAPTVLFNSAYWGQADTIYTSGLLACLLFLINKKEIPAFGFYGFALAVKLQAIFFFPFLLVLLLYRKVSLKSFFIIPGVYFLSILPVLCIGRPILDVFGIYFNQVDTYKWLSMNAPNFYAWVPNFLYDIFLPAGILLAIIVISVLVIFLYRHKIKIGKDQIIALAFYSLVLTPFLLPKMHERYFYPADVLAIILAFYSPRLFYVPIIMVSVSFLSYFPFLFHTAIVDIPILALVLLELILFLILSWKSVLQVNQNVDDDLKKTLKSTMNSDKG